MIEGLQSQGVGASLKHYAANNQETDRLRVSADVDERTLREIYDYEPGWGTLGRSLDDEICRIMLDIAPQGGSAITAPG